MVQHKGSNLPKVKKQNNSLIKEIIYKYSPISRIEIAQMLSLTTPTITNKVTELIEGGLVEEIRPDSQNGNMPDGISEQPEQGTASVTLGRRPVMLDFVPNIRYFAGIELGPYKTTYVIVNLRGEVVYSRVGDSLSGDYDKMIGLLSASITGMIGESGIPAEKFLGIGVGIPGFIEGKTGTIRSSFRSGWNGKNFASDISAAVGFPVVIDNNVRARATGTELYDKSLDTDSFAYYFVSHGIACPLFIRNNAFSGITAGAGEIGHMVVEIDGPKCDTCGNNGCLEAIASENAIIKRCAKLLESDMPTALKQICGDGKAVEIYDILRAQECGDIAVDSIMQTAIRYLGINLANIINFISPPAVIIDAKIFNFSANRELMMDTVQKNLFGLNNQEVNIRFIDYDTLCGAKGAAAVAIKRFFIENGD